MNTEKFLLDVLASSVCVSTDFTAVRSSAATVDSISKPSVALRSYKRSVPMDSAVSVVWGEGDPAKAASAGVAGDETPSGDERAAEGADELECRCVHLHL